MIKANYFPRDDFRGAGICASASWVWSSILVGKDIVVLDGMWIIGNGRRMCVEGPLDTGSSKCPSDRISN